MGTEDVSSDDSDSDRIGKYRVTKETPIIRYNWATSEPYYLVLGHDDGEVDLTRIHAGSMMLLSNHTSWFRDPPRLGQVTSAVLSNKELICEVIHNKTIAGDEYWEGEIEAGIKPNVSVEANILELKEVRKAVYHTDDEGNPRRKVKVPAIFRATKWQPMAFAVVNIPAISSAGKLSNEVKPMNQNDLVFNADPIGLGQNTVNELLERVEQLERQNGELVQTHNELLQSASSLQTALEDSQVAATVQRFKHIASDLVKDAKLSKAEYNKLFENCNDRFKDATMVALTESYLAEVALRPTLLQVELQADPNLDPATESDKDVAAYFSQRRQKNRTYVTY